LLKIGGVFLCKLSLDELPNLINIIKGEMVFVGPRPALYNQDDLMALRVAAGVDQLKPGITGWAQINGRDEISIEEKVGLEKEYLERKSFGFDVVIVVRTFTSVLGEQRGGALVPGQVPELQVVIKGLGLVLVSIKSKGLLR
jgi:O-antigen biosynthesis protein WbqP